MNPIDLVALVLQYLFMIQYPARTYPLEPPLSKVVKAALVSQAKDRPTLANDIRQTHEVTEDRLRAPLVPR